MSFEEKYQKNKNEYMAIFMCIALCCLVIGLSIKHNKVVQEYNELAADFNEKLESAVYQDCNNRLRPDIPGFVWNFTIEGDNGTD